MRVLFYVFCISLLASCSTQLPQHFYTKSLQEDNYIDNYKSTYTLYTNKDKANITAYTLVDTTKHILNGRAWVIKNKHQRPYIKMISGNDTAVVANRHIYFKNVLNFRDIGGLKNTEGKTVKWGKIYRSDNLSRLRSYEFKKFNDLGIKTVFDLRTPQEIEGKKDHLPVEVTYVHAPSVLDHGDLLANLRGRVLRGEISDEESVQFMADFYRGIVADNVPALKELLQAILIKANEPVLYHCSAGKDRTGITTALILSILKVDRETIMNEYLLSDYYRREKVEGTLTKAKLAKVVKPRLAVGVIQNFLSVDERYLNEAFNYIDNNYGGIDAFIKNQLGISDNQRLEIIKKLTY